MKKLLSFIILFLSINLYPQEIENSNIDSLKIFQDLYWLKPINHYGWVTDYEKFYSKKEIKNLNTLITKFEKQTSNEIAIITLDSLRVTEENFDALSLRVANEWGIGKPEKKMEF
ncbi:TPM domain-containing protein [Faecalibacter rhinopitheci]|uniref:TPM domain-containing protein n=1 Tax=Faecalibacter rhinopitheci TaxID=2779678 RepID=A0A8J7K2V6_9FLAO|nr:TPM domain-containing protein [Faecalibacter rhinopitheci]MBF0595853.1 TPM domain-containing protein [Faecalibacter rhinopitheci]